MNYSEEAKDAIVERLDNNILSNRKMFVPKGDVRSVTGSNRTTTRFKNPVASKMRRIGNP